jgi:hypothetical protein
MRSSLLGLLALGALLTAGCDTAGLDDFEAQVVATAVLVADRPLPPVYLARTGPLDEPYDPLARAIVGATVTVSLLAPDGSVEATYAYADSLFGLYRPVDTLALVRSERRYRLEAVVPGFAAPVTAETAVPSAFAIARPLPDPVVFQQGDAPTLDVTPSTAEGRPAVYVFTITALAPVPEALTPFAADLFFERDVGLEDLVSTSSPLVNEENFELNADGTVRIEVPWFGFNFFGPNSVTLTALDGPLQTFIEFQAVQFVPTTISPGEIPNVPTNVRNGVGVFGAVAQVTDTLLVARP